MLLKMEEQMGVKPYALQNMPKVLPRLIWYTEQYQLLQRDRRYAEGTPLPIDNRSIKVFFDMFKLEGFHDFHEYIVRIDRAYLSESGKKTDANRKQAELKSKK